MGAADRRWTSQRLSQCTTDSRLAECRSWTPPVHGEAGQGLPGAGPVTTAGSAAPCAQLDDVAVWSLALMSSESRRIAGATPFRGPATERKVNSPELAMTGLGLSQLRWLIDGMNVIGTSSGRVVEGTAMGR